MNIKCVKTIIGEDLIGDVSENLDGSLTIKKPLMVLMNGNGQGGFSIGLFPYMPFVDQREFTYKQTQFLFQTQPSLELVNEYIRLTSNIVIANTTPDKSNLKLVT